MIKSKTLIFMLLLPAILLSACGLQRDGDASQYKVSLIVKSQDTQFWLSAIAGANAAKAEYNIDLSIFCPQTEEDYEQQNEYIKQSVETGADAIVLSAISYEGNAAAIDAAAAAGVKIVVIDSDVDSHAVSARIGTDNIQAGRMTGAAVLDTVSEMLYVGIVNFDLGSRNGQEREQGLREVLSADSRTEAVYTVNASASSEAALSAADALLTEHPEINALVGLNEPLTVGTALAVVARGRAGQVRVVGFDTNVLCVDMMRHGAISALIAQNPYAMGYLGVERAWQLLTGESTAGTEWLDTATTIITPENMFSPEGQKVLFSFG